MSVRIGAITSGWHESYDLVSTRTSPSLRRREDQAGLFFAWSGLAFFCLVLVFSVAAGWGIWVDMVFAWILVQLVAQVHGQLNFETRSTEADENLVEDPSDRKSLLVETEIWQSGGLTGVDRGFLCVYEGRLLFSGHRSSFALANRDVVSRSVERDGLMLSFRIASCPGMEVRIRGLKRVSFVDDQYAWRLAVDIRSFLLQNQHGEEASELPPLTLDPNLPASEIWWRIPRFLLRLPALLLPWGLLVVQMGLLLESIEVARFSVLIDLPILLLNLHFCRKFTIWTCVPLVEIARTLKMRTKLVGLQ